MMANMAADLEKLKQSAGVLPEQAVAIVAAPMAEEAAAPAAPAAVTPAEPEVLTERKPKEEAAPARHAPLRSSTLGCV